MISFEYYSSLEKISLRLARFSCIVFFKRFQSFVCIYIFLPFFLLASYTFLIVSPASSTLFFFLRPSSFSLNFFIYFSLFLGDSYFSFSIFYSPLFSSLYPSGYTFLSQSSSLFLSVLFIVCFSLLHLSFPPLSPSISLSLPLLPSFFIFHFLRLLCKQSFQV